MATSKTRVLIVDDSALIRRLMTEILSSDPDIEVVGAAPDPLIARTKIKQLDPDVITLDVEMPKMDGLEFLRKIMTLRPMPVIMVSSLTQKGADVTLEALEIGALDFVSKPELDVQHGLSAKGLEIVEKVKAAGNAKNKIFARRPSTKKVTTARPIDKSRKVIAIGSSTGGVEALREVLPALPANTPPVVVVQHMPENFTTSFANRLNGICAMTVKEVTASQKLTNGHVYIAPGHSHLKLSTSGAEFRCSLSDGDPVSGHRPSVDVLFETAAKSLGKNAIGVILTGMGKDGAKGMVKMREAGARTIGQDEASCVVYGMPKAAHDLGAVQEQVPLEKIAERIVNLCSEK